MRLAHAPRKTHRLTDRRYQRSEKAIQRVLRHALSERRINLRVQDLCHEANISSPTLYLHYRSLQEALSAYENYIIRSFGALLPKTKMSREAIFIFLLHFIRRHYHYFCATLIQHNSWVLAQILHQLRPFLVRPTTSDKCYDLYVGNLMTLIFCWGKHERFATTKIPIYVRKLYQVRVMDLGI